LAQPASLVLEAAGAGTQPLSQPQGSDPPILQVRIMPRASEQCEFTRRVRRLDRLTGGLGPSNFPPKKVKGEKFS
jgi:hypothetical protein